MEKKDRLRWKPSEFTNRVGFDLRPESAGYLGLIRAIKAQEMHDPDDVAEIGQYLVTVVYIDEEGHEQESYFNESNVGELDLHPAILFTPPELLHAMNTMRDDVDFYRSVGSWYAGVLQDHYETLVEDAKEILLINHCFDLHTYQSIMTQHILMGMG